MLRLVCDNCGSDFTSRFPHSKACSETCRKARYRAYQRIKQLEYYHEKKTKQSCSNSLLTDDVS